MSDLIEQSERVQAIRKAIFSVADRLNPIVDLCKPYVDGLENLPSDGRFLLVGNHTSAGWPEMVLTAYFVHRELGVRVRGLANRGLADQRGKAVAQGEGRLGMAGSGRWMLRARAWPAGPPRARASPGSGRAGRAWRRC